MSSTEPSAIVTLVVVFDTQHQSTVRIRMSKEYAEKAVSHVLSGPFVGYDANDHPFKLELGDKALAIYIETGSKDS